MAMDLYDTDFGFGGMWGESDYLINSLSHALGTETVGRQAPPWSTILLTKLLQNTSFRNNCINRFADEFNSRFKAENVSGHVDSIAAVMSKEMVNHFDRWTDYCGAYQQYCVRPWADSINVI